MKKDFKYAPGDVVWLMYGNKPISGVITRCFCSKHLSTLDFETIIENEKYFVSNSSNVKNEIGSYGVDVLFPDKESLIKSL